MTNIYGGLITALITPFKNGQIDYQAFENLIELQIKSGVNGIVVGGSTGEGSSLEENEYYDLVKLASDLVKKKIYSNDLENWNVKQGVSERSLHKVSEHANAPKFYGANFSKQQSIIVIAGLAGVSTEYTLHRLKKLESLNIDGVMCTVPYYIRPEQEGLIQHFKMLHDNSRLPLTIYINPGRTGVDLSDETILKLAECERIISIKDAGSDIERPLRLLSKLPAEFSMLTGDDSKAVVYSAHGGKGCISVVANILPDECLELQNHLKDGNYSKALELQQKLLPLYQAIFMEANPIGIKYAAHWLKLCSDEIKMPLTIARSKTQNAIEQVLKDIGKPNV